MSPGDTRRITGHPRQAFHKFSVFVIEIVALAASRRAPSLLLPSVRTEVANVSALTMASTWSMEPSASAVRSLNLVAGSASRRALICSSEMALASRSSSAVGEEMGDQGTVSRGSVGRQHVYV